MFPFHSFNQAIEGPPCATYSARCHVSGLHTQPSLIGWQSGGGDRQKDQQPGKHLGGLPDPDWRGRVDGRRPSSKASGRKSYHSIQTRELKFEGKLPRWAGVDRSYVLPTEAYRVQRSGNRRGLWCGRNKDWSTDTYYHREEPWRQDAQWNKPATKEQIAYDSMSMKSPG